MKKPNGLGTVYKMSGNRRRPWRATITTGYDIVGTQKRLTIGYYETRKEAEKALASYEYNPEKLKNSKLTFKDVYDKWSESHFPKLQSNTVEVTKAYAKKLIPLHDIPFVEIKAIQLQDLFNNLKMSAVSKARVKNIINAMYKYALKYEIVDKDYSILIDLGKREKVIQRKVFTEEEILKLWKYKELKWVDTILIMIYSGMRIGELLGLKNEHIDLENRVIVGAGIKTDAGKNRVIPINKKILPLIQKHMRADKTFLFTTKSNNQILYDNYRYSFMSIMDKLEMTHTIHDCRHTFATLLNNADANPTAIKNIIGHTSFETTEKIYTHKNIEELKKAIDLI